MTTAHDRQQIEANAAGQFRFPAVIATAAAILLYGFLPSDIQPLWLRIPVVAASTLLLLSVSFVNPARSSKGARLFRVASLALAIMLVAANTLALSHTVVLLITTKPGDGVEILIAAAQVWATNVIAFSILMWELDRGGPVARKQWDRHELPPADFRFPQDEDQDTSEEVAEQSAQASDWRPSFVDYFYEAAVASMAFSPGAGVPVRPRAKLLLVFQSLQAFVLLALVIAHAVGSLGS